MILCADASRYVREVVELAVHFKIENVPCVLTIGLVFACPERTADCDLLIERVALCPLDDVDCRGAFHEFTENLFHGRDLIAEIGRHDLKRFVVDAVYNVAVDDDVVGLPVRDFCHPFVHINPAFPEPFLEVILSYRVALVADKIRWPQAHGASDMEIAENQNEPVGSFHN